MLDASTTSILKWIFVFIRCFANEPTCFVLPGISFETKRYKKTTTRITTTTKTNNKCTSNWLIQEYRWIRQKLRHRSRLTDNVDATMLIMTLMMMKLNLLLDSPERKTQTVYLSTQLVYPLCGYVFVLIVCNYISRDKLTLCCVQWLLLFFALLL